MSPLVWAKSIGKTYREIAAWFGGRYDHTLINKAVRGKQPPSFEMQRDIYEKSGKKVRDEDWFRAYPRNRKDKDA